MQDDIAALQWMYGADYGYNKGATVYRWDQNTGEMYINDEPQHLFNTLDGTILMTIWDGVNDWNALVARALIALASIDGIRPASS